LRQTRWVCERLRGVDRHIEIEEVIIRTHGDLAANEPINEDWPMGGFVGAIEVALIEGRIDFAVHSYKDLPTVATGGLLMAAVPERELPHDVLVTREPVDFAAVPPGLRVGTSSPRRAAQLRQFLSPNIQAVPIRGNVPTRIVKVRQGVVDAVVLAAAGLRRLGLSPAHAIDLPVEQFVPAPAQGALAVQARQRAEFLALLREVNDEASERRVAAERSFLATVGPGCHTPVGALATIEGDRIRLHGQLFESHEPTLEGRDLKWVEGEELGSDPVVIGVALARRLIGALKR